MGSTGGRGGGGDLMVKQGNFCHCRGNDLHECHHLALQVEEEGIKTPLTNDIDSTIGDVGLVDHHGAPRAK